MIEIIPQPTPINHTKGRKGFERPLAIVDHIIEGSIASAGSWFRDPRAQVSAHYGVSRSGAVVQYVADEDTAWHAGRVLRPTAPLVPEIGVNPNRWTIGIEHEGYADTPATPEMVEASARLHALLSMRHGIPLDRRHVILHREVYAAKTCPGVLPVDQIVARAVALAGAPTPGDRRWSHALGGWVILTGYRSDGDWDFVLEPELADVGHRAGAPWSSMPLGPDR